MKTVTFEPSICKPKTVGEAVVPPEYSGTVTVRLPCADERLGLYEGVPTADQSDEKSKEAAGRALMRNAVRASKDFITAVDITRADDGYKLTAEDLNYDSDMLGVVTEIATKLVGKHRAGASLPTT